MNAPARITVDADLPRPGWMTADPCFLLKVILTPDGMRRTAGTLTGGMYSTPADAMAESGSTVWAKVSDEWRSDDGEWIVRRAQT